MAGRLLKKNKVLLVDNSLGGHHLPYLRTLLQIPSEEFEISALLSERVDDKSVRCFLTKRCYDLRKWSDYAKWVDEVACVAASEEVDLVHLLYGDCLYRHFGALLGKVPCRKMATFHQFRHSALRDLSVKRIHKTLDLSVVHTDSLARFARSCGGCEVAVVQYPVFESLSGVPDPDEAKRAWGLKPGVPAVAALGGTRTDKGLDILLEALRDVEGDYQLLVAGAEQSIGRESIEEATSLLGCHASVNLRYLSEEELVSAAQAADIVALPYRRSFDGASGPLGIGAALGKVIVGPDHGSVGETIRENHLGYVFEAENIKSLATAMQNALRMDFINDECYTIYKESLSPVGFQESYVSLYRGVF